MRWLERGGSENRGTKKEALGAFDGQKADARSGSKKGNCKQGIKSQDVRLYWH
jgi:hypothetical protein